MTPMRLAAPGTSSQNPGMKMTIAGGPLSGVRPATRAKILMTSAPKKPPSSAEKTAPPICWAT